MIYIYISAILLFILRIVFIVKGSLKEKSVKNEILSEGFPFISVVVPSRNEENNISRILDSLLNSNYPSDKFEILAVNDRSEDNTESIIKEYSEKYPIIKLINVKHNESGHNLKGKPGALQAGFDVAKGDYVLMTDADCAVHPNWIKSMAGNFKSGGYDFLASFTLISGTDIFSRLQAVEWIYMHTMASAGVGNNTPLGCFGNNLAIKKSLYDEIGGYSNIDFSVTEDLALQKAVFRNKGKVHYLCDENSTVTTLPCNTLTEYLKQKKRWAVGGTALGWKAIYFVMSSMLIWISLILSVIYSDWLWLAIILSVRLLGDFIAIETSVASLKLKSIRKWIIPSVVFFTIMELLVPMTLLTGKVRWKGQKF